jgi:hypothetical protein
MPRNKPIRPPPRPRGVSTPPRSWGPYRTAATNINFTARQRVLPNLAPRHVLRPPRKSSRTCKKPFDSHGCASLVRHILVTTARTAPRPHAHQARGLAPRAFAGDRLVCDYLRGLPRWRRPHSGQGMPLAIQRFVTLTNSSWEIGGLERALPVRSTPGDHAQSTSESCPKCSASRVGPRPPLRARSVNARQMSPTDNRSHAIDNGARCQPGAPGTPLTGLLVDWWQVEQCRPAAPCPAGPRSTLNRCRC